MQTPTKSLIDNFDFLLFGQGTKLPFRGYVSAIDPTTAGVGVLIGGSQNTHKTLLGTVKVRDGLKRRGPADDTAAGVISSFEWETSLGVTRELRAVNGTLQVAFDTGSGINYYDLMTGLTDAEMLFSFAAWWDDANKKDDLIFVNGQQEINMWGGGIAIISTAANTAGVINGVAAPNNITSAAFGQFSSGGIGYVVDDVITLTLGDGTAQLVVDSVVAGGVQTVGILSGDSGGSGYTVGDLVKVGGGTTQALIQVTGVSGGAVTSIQILTTGIGNALGSHLVTTNVVTTGSPSGLTLSISAIGNTISTWHFHNNGGGYSISASQTPSPTTGGTGTGATVWIEIVTTGRVTISGTDTASEQGFAGSPTPTDGILTYHPGTFIADGVTYAYTSIGDDGFSFIGVTPDPSGISPGDVGFATVITSSQTSAGNDFADVFGAHFTNDYIDVEGNQLYVGCYSARPIYMSSDSSYLDFGPIPVIRAPGDPNVYILDTNSRGVSGKTGQDGNVVLFGSQGDSYSIARTTSTVQISADPAAVFADVENEVINKQTSSDLSSPISNDFITSVGDTILFLDENNQLRQFGTLRNLVTPVYPILSLDVYTELANSDPTGGHLRAVGEQSGETVYIMMPRSGKLYFYQIRNQVDQVGNLTAERVWQPPFIVGGSRIAVIEGITYVYSNSNPQMYQLWNTGQYSDDSPSDEPIPYESHAIFAYLSGSELASGRAQFIEFDKIYYEGYMTRGTSLYNNVYYEFDGAKGIQTVRVNVPTNPGKKLAKFYDGTNTPSLGDVSLGLIPLGDGVLPQGGSVVPKFRAMRRVQSQDVFEFALDIASYDLDSEWEMLTIGANIQESTNRPTGIMAVIS